jgi:hypothetical protein
MKDIGNVIAWNWFLKICVVINCPWRMYLFLKNTTLCALQHLTFSTLDGSDWCFIFGSLCPWKMVRRTYFTGGWVGPGTDLETPVKKTAHLQSFEWGFVVYPASSFNVKRTGLSRFRLYLQVKKFTKPNPKLRINGNTPLTYKTFFPNWAYCV